MPGEVEWIFDVAHNVPAAQGLARQPRALPRARTIAVCGILGDKDIRGITAALGADIDAWVLVALEGPRAVSTAEMLAQHLPAGARVLDARAPMSPPAVARRAPPRSRAIASSCSDRSSRSDRRSNSLAGIRSAIVRAMDSRAKQRLTGAVILVALFVLLVPELLTGPARHGRRTRRPKRACAATPSISTRQRIRASHRPHPPSPPVALPPVENPMQPRRARARDARRIRRARAPSRARAEPPGHRCRGTEQCRAPQLRRRRGPRRRAAHPQPRVEPRARPRHPPRRCEHGSFAVQLGSFGSRDNADRLVRDMTAKGFAAFVAPIKSSGRELYRVRVGPTRDRAQAEALAAQLRRIGQSGSIVPIS